MLNAVTIAMSIVRSVGNRRRNNVAVQYGVGPGDVPVCLRVWRVGILRLRHPILCPGVHVFTGSLDLSVSRVRDSQVSGYLIMPSGVVTNSSGSGTSGECSSRRLCCNSGQGG